MAGDGRGAYVFAWVKATIEPDPLNLANYTVWLRGLDGGTLAPRYAEARTGDAAGWNETHPSLASGPGGETLLITHQLRSGARQIAARRLTLPARVP